MKVRYAEHHDREDLTLCADQKSKGDSLPGLQGRFDVIYADPPWAVVTYSSKGKGRSPERHFQCMTFPELCALLVQNHVASDCCLFLWTTDPMLPGALEMINA